MFFLQEGQEEIIQLYKILSLSEFEVIKGMKFKLFPRRFFVDKNFLLLKDKELTENIAINKNIWKSNIKELVIVKFLARREDIIKFEDTDFVVLETLKLQDKHLQTLNNAIIGLIEVYKVINFNKSAN